MESHSLADARVRVLHGGERVYYAAPTKEFGAVQSGIMLLGLVLAALARNSAVLIVALCLVVQLSPVVWSMPANPTLRIPAASILPFGLVFAAYLFAQCLRAQSVAWQSLRGTGHDG